MTLTKVDTTHFSDVELQAKRVAEEVRGLKSKLAKSRRLTVQHWMGEGLKGYNNLYYVVERQLKDISDEYWEIYEALIDAEGKYIEADQELATQIDSGEFATAKK